MNIGLRRKRIAPGNAGRTAACGRRVLDLAGQRILVEFSQLFLNPRHQGRIGEVGEACRRPRPVAIAEIGMGRIPGDRPRPARWENEIIVVVVPGGTDLPKDRVLAQVRRTRQASPKCRPRQMRLLQHQNNFLKRRACSPRRSVHAVYHGEPSARWPGKTGRRPCQMLGGRFQTVIG